MGQTIFAVKLYELEQQYEKLLSRIHLCQEDSPKRLKEEIEDMSKECREERLSLARRTENSRSPAVSALSKAQLSYQRQVEKILDNELKNLLSDGQIQENQAESKLLYAEYSIDFALLSMKEAILAAMSAVLEEKNYEKWRNDNE